MLETGIYSRLHRGRRQGGRHRRRAAGVHRPYRQADARGLSFVHNALVGIGLRDSIKLGAAGKIITGFDIARAMALGADWCNAARGFMFAVGCIQSQSCHTDRCPTGVATQDRIRQKALVVRKSPSRGQLPQGDDPALADLTAAAGLDHPRELRPFHFMHRAAPDRVVTFAELFPFLSPGELLEGTDQRQYRDPWDVARADSFVPRSERMQDPVSIAAE